MKFYDIFSGYKVVLSTLTKPESQK